MRSNTGRWNGGSELTENAPQHTECSNCKAVNAIQQDQIADKDIPTEILLAVIADTASRLHIRAIWQLYAIHKRVDCAEHRTQPISVQPCTFDDMIHREYPLNDEVHNFMLKVLLRDGGADIEYDGPLIITRPTVQIARLWDGRFRAPLPQLDDDVLQTDNDVLQTDNDVLQTDGEDLYSFELGGFAWIRRPDSMTTPTDDDMSALTRAIGDKKI